MKRAVKSRPGSMGNIRIIAGQWRGRKLPVLDLEGLRPTTDRTKETLFNWLAPYLAERRCLDGFAGSGGLGFEALSRHAQSVVFVEKDKQAALLISKNIQTLQLDPLQAKVENMPLDQFLKRQSGAFDLVFLDPPFHQGLLQPCVDLLQENRLLNPKALIYIETEPEVLLQLPADWMQIKSKQTKQVTYQLYQVP